MADASKKIEITEDFLEKHRNNTRKYMHLLNPSKEKSENLQETLSRIESRFGISTKRSQSLDSQSESIRVSDDKSLQDFIKQIREKYLSPSEVSIKAPLIDLSDAKVAEKSANSQIFTEDLLDLQLSTPVKPEKSKLLVSDLISEPSPLQNSPFHKPPRAKHHLDETLHESPDREDNNKTLFESSMSMSFRRVQGENIFAGIISEVVANRLNLCKKKKEKELKTQDFSFDKFLNAKTKFAPLKKTVNLESIWKEDKVLKELVEKKERVLKEIEGIEAEKKRLLRLVD